MTTIFRSKLVVCVPATALALLLHQTVLAQEAAPPTEAPAEAQPAVPVHPAQAAREAREERRAAHMAELNQRYEELRKQAVDRGFEMPPAPPWTEGPQWLSYDEMRKLMEGRGIALPAAPSGEPVPVQAPETPPVATDQAEEIKGVLETIEKMTPEQQNACFALSRWQVHPMMPHRLPPYSRPRMPQRPPVYGPGYGQPYPGMMRPLQ